MSKLKTIEEFQTELSNIYKENIIVKSYRGRYKTVDLELQCGCNFSVLPRPLLQGAYTFCTCYKKKKGLDYLKGLYPEYEIDIDFKTCLSLSNACIKGIYNGKEFNVVKSYRRVKDGILNLTTKELGIPREKKKRNINSTYNIENIKREARQNAIEVCSNLFPFNDYTSIVYGGSKGKVKNIRCIEHNEYFDCNYSGREHKKGRGIYCPKCKEQKELDRLEEKRQEYIEMFNKKYNGKYGDYSDFIYLGCNKNSRFVCPDHGEFKQTPISHASTIYGCQKCGAEAGHGYSKSSYIKTCVDRVCSLYLARIYNDRESFYKVGISVNIKDRFSDLRKESGYRSELMSVIEGTAKEVWELENKIKRGYKMFSYVPNNVFGGHTECYGEEGLEDFKLFFNKEIK